MEIKKAITEIKDFGIDAYSRLKITIEEKRIKKQAAKRQMRLMSGCIRRVK